MKEKLGFILLFAVLSFNLYKTFNFLWADFTIMENFPGLSYDEKMRHKIGKDFYNYTLFLRKYLPQDATVLIPPMAFPWAQTGNIYYLNYFLYPRKLVYGGEETIAENKNITYALMLWGESGPSQEYKQGWPKFPVKAEEIILWNENKIEFLKKDFYPEQDMKEGVWGLIKLRRN